MIIPDMVSSFRRGFREERFSFRTEPRCNVPVTLSHFCDVSFCFLLFGSARVRNVESIDAKEGKSKYSDHPVSPSEMNTVRAVQVNDELN